jgi:hypothetical protein
VVAQLDRPAEGAETDAVLGDAGHRLGPGDRSGRQHQHVVAQLPRDALGGDTVATFRAGSTVDTRPVSTRHPSRVFRGGTTTCRGSMEPAAASGRNG